MYTSGRSKITSDNETGLLHQLTSLLIYIVINSPLHFENTGSHNSPSKGVKRRLEDNTSTSEKRPRKFTKVSNATTK